MTQSKFKRLSKAAMDVLAYLKENGPTSRKVLCEKLDVKTMRLSTVIDKELNLTHHRIPNESGTIEYHYGLAEAPPNPYAASSE